MADFDNFRLQKYKYCLYLQNKYYAMIEIYSNKNSQLVIYQTPEGDTRINVRTNGNTSRLTTRCRIFPSNRYAKLYAHGCKSK